MSAGDVGELDGAQFERARGLIRSFAGISLADSKKVLVQGRLNPRLRALGLGPDDYLSLVERDAVEAERFVNALTTNVTDFFRERHHFDALERQIFPRLVAARDSTRRIRIWSAGCSTGEEPYSIAMTVQRGAIPSDFDVKILATDLDSDVVARAAAGQYPVSRMESVSANDRRRFFQLGKGSLEGQARVNASTRELVTFRQLNLMREWPMRGPFDVIFCRNVMIYFDDATRRALVDRYVRMLAPGGSLILGHSESLMGMHPRLKSNGKTMFDLIS